MRREELEHAIRAATEIIHSDRVIVIGSQSILGSYTDSEFGFYIQGVGRETAVLPRDWEYRLVGVRNENTKNSTGLCLDPYDLCAAKLIAARPKDHAFVLALVGSGLIDTAVLAERIMLIPPGEPRRESARAWVQSVAAKPAPTE